MKAKEPVNRGTTSRHNIAAQHLGTTSAAQHRSTNYRCKSQSAGTRGIERAVSGAGALTGCYVNRRRLPSVELLTGCSSATESFIQGRRPPIDRLRVSRQTRGVFAVAQLMDQAVA